MALKDMLKASAAEEAAQLSSSKADSSRKKSTVKPEVSTPPFPEKVEKHPGGRPPKTASEKRKQYTLTLRPDTYDLFMQVAKGEDPDQSFSKFMEKAAYEYIEKHQ